MKGSMKTSEMHKCLSTSEADSHSSIALELVLVEEELNIDIPCDLHTGGGTREPSSQGQFLLSSSRVEDPIRLYDYDNYEAHRRM